MHTKKPISPYLSRWIPPKSKDAIHPQHIKMSTKAFQGFLDYYEIEELTIQTDKETGDLLIGLIKNGKPFPG